MENKICINFPTKTSYYRERLIIGISKHIDLIIFDKGRGGHGMRQLLCHVFKYFM